MRKSFIICFIIKSVNPLDAAPLKTTHNDYLPNVIIVIMPFKVIRRLCSGHILYYHEAIGTTCPEITNSPQSYMFSRLKR